MLLQWIYDTIKVVKILYLLGMDQFDTSHSIENHENKALHDDLVISLRDGILSHEEAQELHEKYAYKEEQLDMIYDNQKQDILNFTKEHKDVLMNILNHETLVSAEGYFDIPNLQEINTQLTTDWLDLNIVQYLDGYKSYIEQDLSSLDPQIKQKIILSIKVRISQLPKEIEEAKLKARKWIKEINENQQDPAKHLDENDLSRVRWIINSEIQESLKELTNKILPSAFMLQEYTKSENRAQFIEDIVSKLEFEAYINKGYEGMPSMPVSVEMQQNISRGQLIRTINDIEEMFDAPVDAKNWQFDEWGLNSKAQIETLHIDRWGHVQRFEAMWWDINKLSQITLLNEQDKKVEKDAMLFFMWAIAWHMAIEWGPAALASVVPGIWTAAWTIVGNFLWAGIDLADLFSDKEALMEMLKTAWIVPEEFEMKKTFVDNILAWVWLVPWMTLAVKSAKLASLMSKFWVVWTELLQSMEKVLPILKWSKNTDYPSVRNLDDITSNSSMLSKKFLNILGVLWDNEKMIVSINTGFETKKLEVTTWNYKQVLSEFDNDQLWTMKVLKVISESTDDVSYSSTKLPDDWLEKFKLDTQETLNKKLKEEDLKLEDLTPDDYDYFGINPDRFSQNPIDVVVEFVSWDIATFSWTPDMIMRLTTNPNIASISQGGDKISDFVDPLYKHNPKNTTIAYDELLDWFNAKIPESARYMSNESDLVDMPFYHGTMSSMQESVMAGPKNMWKWFGWKWLYIAIGEERHIAEEYSGLAKQAHDLNKPWEDATKVVLEWNINPEKNLRVWTFTITRNGPVDLEKGILPSMWADDPRLQALLIREFDVLDIRWAADAGMNLQTNRILIFHESAWADAIIWKWWDQLVAATKPVDSLEKWDEIEAVLTTISAKDLPKKAKTLEDVIPLERRKDSFAVNFSTWGHVSVHYFDEAWKPMVFEWSPAISNFLQRAIKSKYRKGNINEERNSLDKGAVFLFSKDEDMMMIVRAFAKQEEWEKTWSCSKLASDVLINAGIDINSILTPQSLYRALKWKTEINGITITRTNNVNALREAQIIGAGITNTFLAVVFPMTAVAGAVISLTIAIDEVWNISIKEKNE